VETVSLSFEGMTVTEAIAGLILQEDKPEKRWLSIEARKP
jgi:hypothetical protein